MAYVVTLQGSLFAGQPQASGTGFPSGMVNIGFELTPPNKVATCSMYQTPNLNSPSSFATLPGVGDGGTVTQGTFLYLKTANPMEVRVTQHSDSGDVVSTLYVEGVYVQEFPVGNYLKLLEAQGVGTIEYFVSGNQ
jgi:hypothetical protein